MMRDLERYARNIRNENRASISTGSGEPNPNDGNDGDIKINTTSGGLKLYAKYKGQWYATGLTKILNKPNKINPIGIPLLKAVVGGDNFLAGGGSWVASGNSQNPNSDSNHYVAINKSVHAYDFTGTNASFEGDIATLAAKINEIIEKIQ